MPGLDCHRPNSCFLILVLLCSAVFTHIYADSKRSATFSTGFLYVSGTVDRYFAASDALSLAL